MRRYYIAATALLVASAVLAAELEGLSLTLSPDEVKACRSSGGCILIGITKLEKLLEDASSSCAAEKYRT